MSTTTKTVHPAIATLGLPNKVPALITSAQGITKALTGNPAFPTTTPTLSGSGGRRGVRLLLAYAHPVAQGCAWDRAATSPRLGS
jgi:hypothetical protein